MAVDDLADHVGEISVRIDAGEFAVSINDQVTLFINPWTIPTT